MVEQERSGSRVRARLVRLGAPRTPQHKVLGPLLRTVRASHPKADVTLLERAYAVAEHAHRGQTRKSGDPYITHPLAVTTILAELGMQPAVLAAALLHDTVEDTDYSLTQLREDFGEEIALLVDGVTKLDKMKYGDAAQAETVRKMVVAMAKDIRVLVIKLADRLHNARTWRYVSVESATRKANETLEIYAPLAHRLGMNTIKWELEDLCFAVLHPKLYDEIARLVADAAPAREQYLQGFREQVSTDLKAARIDATVTSRPKHYYSVYQKMIVRGREFKDIYDLVAVRILVDSVRDCYAVLGTLHTRWSPVPGRFKDYIATPKMNMYQSLHTTIIGPDGKSVEIQIRTHAMHHRAEYGVAAHWKYKDDAKSAAAPVPAASDGGQLDEMAWFRQLLEWQRETADPDEFLDNLRFDVGSQEVYVFTPKGEVVGLPVGSTPVDFAYAVHTEVGHHTIGARINGRLAPLESPVENGDVIEVLTSKADGAGPSRDWLGFVASPRARSKIRQWFSRERREEAIDSGKDQLTKALRKQGQGIARLTNVDTMAKVATGLHYQDVDSLYAAIGDNHVSAEHVSKLLREAVGPDEPEPQQTPESAPIITRAETRRRAGDPGVTVVGTDDVWVKLARCCTPMPGDDILGFVTTGHGVSVHRDDCTNAAQLKSQPDRLVEVAWAPSAASVFMVQLQVEALDRKGLLSDVTRVLSEQHVNILSANLSTANNRVAVSRFTFEMGDAGYLDHVIRAVRKVDGVFDVYRLTGSGQRVGAS
ncbi:bifunctional (p)ppGpp synthetase/guanosine-3',5'-bis(diphosphate) 3'-pyrophosphohydrolase [Yimella sp. RIT 621]|uniref:RelA/SpoT family protein n=1 Tax=Yimella sp. RIT 621 TaxID=2510323 RepID=UPI00101CFA65|nr:bifunctional (p)ppGpp synthetase/guanosine-3',5'-bis(diphosphate) 3'-pyrophosphohydrolase [Yimella sp. RIT 621]RYG78838.1 bifunctional (p)ppGpp synthetase/guanosine-3',5'-bis(diphosphate) 3'-pyrophosphohydrolase [Yimella sp. RIT 621]